ncbi:hypothetical protein [uncultured Allomuricauda sp.]|uniref:hypothetical protein n=1 Tax=Flagellimonas sp. W118 TaxID=3410791 RepID=UPI002623F07E|nr:hypothetical protein [uncultured Allomuricauda sp.]
MDGKKTTQQKIDEVLEAASQIETVDTSPFFKDKVLHRLTNREELEEALPILGWFTLKYQVAALLLFVVLNAVAIYNYRSSNQQEEIVTFADAFGISSTDQQSILN